MERHGARPARHAHGRKATHGRARRMEGGAGCPDQGAPRPFRMPPQDGETRKSYRIADALVAVACAACLATAAWGLGVAYQVGYHAGEAQAVVQHG